MWLVALAAAGAAPNALAVPAAERSALIDLYNATCGTAWGASWRNASDTDFKAAGTECTWDGVSCDGTSSTVIGIAMSGFACGALPASIGDFENLETLQYRMVGSAFNFLTGPLPAEIGKLAKLKTLDLSNNMLTGTIPPAWSGLASLEYLDLGDQHSLERLSGSVPAWLGSLANLTHLGLRNNAFDGTIPLQLGALTQLQELSLDGNDLSGAIPGELGNLANLQWFIAHGNQLTGAIPPELGNLANLQGLYLFSNRLSGTFPVELCALGNLRELDLSGNLLTGTLPGALGNLTNLRLFVVAENAFSGELPASMATWANLYNGGINLGYNALHSSDAALSAFVDTWQFGGDWRSTQTIAPTDPKATTEGADSVTLSWTPIAYQDDGGGYRVRYGKQSGGPYVAFATTTADKAAGTLTVTGLAPATTYYFVVETWTDPHPVSGRSPQQNTVVSEPSAEVAAMTRSPPAIPALGPWQVVLLAVALLLAAMQTLRRPEAGP